MATLKLPERACGKYNRLMPAKPPSKNYTCNDYREEMRLLGLKKRLLVEDLPESEKRELLAEIALLEKKMGMG